MATRCCWVSQGSGLGVQKWPHHQRRSTVQLPSQPCLPISCVLGLNKQQQGSPLTPAVRQWRTRPLLYISSHWCEEKATAPHTGASVRLSCRVLDRNPCPHP